MPDSKFDLGDYVEVKDRIKLFYELYGNGRLVTDRYELTREPDDKPKVIVLARAYRTPEDPYPGVGLSWMYLPGSTSYTKGSELENVETSAWGRAIGSLGILIDRSIASGNEIRAKAEQQTSPPPTTDGGLIGTAEVGKAPSDFELRVGPGGSAVSFRLAQGRKGIKVVCLSPLADALYAVRTDIIGHRVTCWGKVAMESFTKDGRLIEFQVLTLERIQTPTFTLPAMEALGQEVAPDESPGNDPSGPSTLFSPADEAELDAAATAA